MTLGRARCPGVGVDLSKMDTIGDLQGGLEEAERLLGYAASRADGAVGP